MWTCQNFDVIIPPYWIIACFVLISILFHRKLNKYYYRAVVLLSCIVVLMDFFSFLKKRTYVIEDIPTASEIYKVGKSFSEITGCKIVTSYTEDDYVIRSHAVRTKIPYNKRGVVILEHSPEQTNEIVTGGKWQQPVSWHDNVPFSNQYFTEAIIHDGGLWSNIGTNLKDTCDVLLAYENIRHGYQPLIVKNGDVTFLHDSDYTSGRLVNYQQSFVKELFSPIGFDRPLYMRILNFTLLIISLVIIKLEKRNKKSLYIINTALLSSIAYFYFSSIGDAYGNVRLVGEIKDSHENNRFDGVIKTMVDDGLMVKLGEKNCTFLIVQENNSAKYLGEKIIVLEPGAEISIDGKKYKANKIPGPSFVTNDSLVIVDTRTINCEGKETTPIFSVVNKENSNITIIATGSPALLNWNKLSNMK